MEGSLRAGRVTGFTGKLRGAKLLVFPHTSADAASACVRGISRIDVRNHASPYFPHFSCCVSTVCIICDYYPYFVSVVSSETLRFAAGRLPASPPASRGHASCVTNMTSFTPRLDTKRKAMPLQEHRVLDAPQLGITHE